MANKDPVLRKILHEVGGEEIRGTQEEGAFFTKSLFHDICEVVNRNYDHHMMEFVYAREEIYFSTIIWNWKSCGRKIKAYRGGNFVYIPWEKDLRIEIDDIKCKLKEKDQIFSVKRIERELKDPVRSYIREEVGGGYINYRNRLYTDYVMKPFHRLILYVYKKSLLTRIRSQDKIVLYGAGRYGERFLEFLYDNYLSEKVSCFVVSDLKDNVHEINGIPVKGLSDFLREAGNKRVMVTVSKRLQEEIGEDLCEKGYENYEIISHDFLYALIMDPVFSIRVSNRG